MLEFLRRDAARVRNLPIERIRTNPYQPRRHFNKRDLAELSESIAQSGVLQPLLVRPAEGGDYELISGERRLRASALAGLREVPCILHEVEDDLSSIYAIIENIQRADLNFFEEAAAIEKLITTFGLTQEQAARRLSKSQSAVANKLRLLRLDPEVKETILLHGLTERHARALLRLGDPALQKRALLKVCDQGLNVSETEALCESLLNPPAQPKKVVLIKDVRIFLNTINHALKVMKQSGIAARSDRTETAEYIEYSIRIPKG